MNWTPEQEYIFEAAKTGKHIIVEAKPGTGKTTTSIEINNRVAGMGQFMAFNKAIIGDLKEKGCMNAKTLNAFGHHLCQEATSTGTFNPNKVLDLCVILNIPRHVSRKMANLVDRARSFGEINPNLDAYFDEMGWDLNKLDHGRLVDNFPRVMQAVLDSEDWDFADQTFRPVHRNYSMAPYDYVIVDESQDLNKLQVDLVVKVAKQIICVGDPLQAIYGFRGAMDEAIRHLATATGAHTYGLTKTFRCAPAIVEEARRVLPCKYSSGRTDFDGIVDTIWQDEIKYMEDAAILCRVNAPLMQLAFRQARRGSPCHLVGSPADKSLFLNHLANAPDDRVRLRSYLTQRAAMFENKFNWDQSDICQSLVDCLNYANDKQDLQNGINRLFGSTEGTAYSSIHRAKGREWRVVYLIAPDKIPHPKATDLQQERQLHFVAVTRAKDEFYYVKGT